MQGYEQTQVRKQGRILHLARAIRDRRLAFVEDRETADEISEFLAGSGLTAQMSQHSNTKEAD
jgi:hypothetical protein